MNTKTMRLPPRRVLTANKRQEGEDPDPLKRLTSAKPSSRPNSAQAGSDKAAASAEPVESNRLLAGYLAHEFLTKGTLFGEPWDPLARAQAVEPRKRELAEPTLNEDKRRRYVEVSHLLKADGTHLADVVNPAQLIGFLKL